MRTAVAILVIIATAAIAAPVDDIPDSIVPEQDLELYQMHGKGHDDELAEAKEQIRDLMKAGKSDKQCRELADASKQEVKDAIKTQRDMLATEEDGSVCLTLGQEAIKAAEDSLDEAKKSAATKKKDYEKKRDANVDFPSYPLSSLSPGTCNQFYDSSVYKNAAAARDQAKGVWETAKGVETGAVKSLADAKIAAENQKNECLCTIQKNQNKAYDAATKKANTDSMDKLWRKGHLLHCALDHKDAAHCPIGDTPKITRADLNIIAEAKNKDCTAYKAPQYHFAPKGANSCEGNGTGVGYSDCLAAGNSLLTAQQLAKQGRKHIVAGHWTHVPPGCSVQITGDMAVHYNNDKAGGKNDGSYSPVCKTG